MKIFLLILSVLFLFLSVIMFISGLSFTIIHLYLALVFFVLFVIFAVMSDILYNQDKTNNYLKNIFEYMRYIQEAEEVDEEEPYKMSEVDEEESEIWKLH